VWIDPTCGFQDFDSNVGPASYAASELLTAQFLYGHRSSLYRSVPIRHLIAQISTKGLAPNNFVVLDCDPECFEFSSWFISSPESRNSSLAFQAHL
jgi:hypothetical protein